MGRDEFDFSWGELQGRATIARRVGIVMFAEPWPSYAWPGGYPIGYLCDDGEWLYGKCMNDPSNPIHFRGNTDGWRIDGVDIIEESEYGEFCSNCSAVLCEGYSNEEVIL